MRRYALIIVALMGLGLSTAAAADGTTILRDEVRGLVSGAKLGESIRIDIRPREALPVSAQRIDTTLQAGGIFQEPIDFVPGLTDITVAYGSFTRSSRVQVRIEPQELLIRLDWSGGGSSAVCHLYTDELAALDKPAWRGVRRKLSSTSEGIYYGSALGRLYPMWVHYESGIGACQTTVSAYLNGRKLFSVQQNLVAASGLNPIGGEGQPGSNPSAWHAGTFALSSDRAVGAWQVVDQAGTPAVIGRRTMAPQGVLLNATDANASRIPAAVYPLTAYTLQSLEGANGTGAVSLSLGQSTMVRAYGLVDDVRKSENKAQELLGICTLAPTPVGILDGRGVFTALAPGTVTIVASDSKGSSQSVSPPDGWQRFGHLSSITITVIGDATDRDGDGLPDATELAIGTDPTMADTDGDGIGDAYEVRNQLNPVVADANEDRDGDGLTNAAEAALGTAADRVDTDGDRVSDGQEVAQRTNPLSAEDADGDRLSDAAEAYFGTDPNLVDSDGDFIADGIEVMLGSDPAQITDIPAVYDPDKDGLSTSRELWINANMAKLGYAGASPLDPTSWDSDGDMLADGYEVNAGIDPTKSNRDSNGAYGDLDGDGLNDFDEYVYGTNPRKADSDDDGTPDGVEIARFTNPNDSSDGAAVNRGGPEGSGMPTSPSNGAAGPGPMLVNNPPGDMSEPGDPPHFPYAEMDLGINGCHHYFFGEEKPWPNPNPGSFMLEYWNMKIGNPGGPGPGGVNVFSLYPFGGLSGPRSYTFKRGYCYPIQIQHVGTDTENFSTNIFWGRYNCDLCLGRHRHHQEECPSGKGRPGPDYNWSVSAPFVNSGGNIPGWGPGREPWVGMDWGVVKVKDAHGITVLSKGLFVYDQDKNSQAYENPPSVRNYNQNPIGPPVYNFEGGFLPFSLLGGIQPPNLYTGNHYWYSESRGKQPFNHAEGKEAYVYLPYARFIGSSGDRNALPRVATSLKKRPGSVFEPVIQINYGGEIGKNWTGGGYDYPNELGLSLYGCKRNKTNIWSLTAVARGDNYLRPAGYTIQWSGFPGAGQGETVIVGPLEPGRYTPTLTVRNNQGQITGVASIHSIVVEDSPSDLCPPMPQELEDRNRISGTMVRIKKPIDSDLGPPLNLDVYVGTYHKPPFSQESFVRDTGWDERMAIYADGARGRFSLDGYPQNEYWAGPLDHFDLDQFYGATADQVVYFQGYEGHGGASRHINDMMLRVGVGCLPQNDPKDGERSKWVLTDEWSATALSFDETVVCGSAATVNIDGVLRIPSFESSGDYLRIYDYNGTDLTVTKQQYDQAAAASEPPDWSDRIIITGQHYDLVDPAAGTDRKFSVSILVGKAVKPGLYDVRLTANGTHWFKKGLCVLKVTPRKLSDGDVIAPLDDNQLPISMPIPVVKINGSSFTADRAQASTNSLKGVVTLSGSLASSMCDITEGAQGQIDRIDVYLNRDDEPIASIPVSVTKGSGPPPRKYPFSGTFNASIPVTVFWGPNTFTLVAQDKVLGKIGMAELLLECRSSSPADPTPTNPAAGGFTQFAQPLVAVVDLTGLKVDDLEAGTASLAMTVTSLIDGVDAVTGTMKLKTKSQRGLVLTDGDVSLIVSAQALRDALAGTIDTFTATVDCPSITSQERPVTFRRAEGNHFVSDFYRLDIVAPGGLDGSAAITATVTRGAAGTAITKDLTLVNGQWQSADQTLAMTMATSSSDDGVQGITTSITSSTLGLTGSQVQAANGSDQGRYSSANLKAVDPSNDPSGSLHAQQPEIQWLDDRDDFQALVLELEGPYEVLGQIHLFNTLSGKRRVIFKDGRFFVADQAGKRQTMVVLPRAEVNTPQSWGDLFDSLQEIYDRQASEPYDPNNPVHMVEYKRGFLVGAVGGGVAIVTDGLDLVSSVCVGAHDAFDALGLQIAASALWWFEEDNSYIGQEILIKNHNAVVGGATKALKVTSDMALGIYNVAKSVHERQTEIAEAVIMGDVAKLNEIGGHYALMLEMGWTIMGEMSEVYNGLPPYERGEIEGRVFFEIATIVIPQTKAVQALKLTKAQTTLKIAESIRKSKWLSTCRPATKAKVEEALTRACIIANHLLDMCFVAGTPIQVDGGWKPIEAIAVGDSVYSSNPIDGTSGYKRVLNVVVTHPSTLYHITYRGTETECELVCTGPHPFWVSNKSCFIPADRLSVGDHLLIADGASAVVSGITVEDAAEGTAFTTYNFEVEEFHTYYAGEVPVLVHNKSPRPCEMIFEMMLEIEKTNPSFDPHTQFQAAILHLVKEGKLNPEDEFIEAMLLKLRKKFYDGKLIEPTSLPYHEGQKAGSSVEGLNWHHWWPTEYLTEEEIAEGVIKHFGPTFELATPSLHTKRPNGIHIKMRRFIADSLGAATVKEGKALFRELPFEEQYEILKQFYKGQGYQMPTFISAGKSR